MRNVFTFDIDGVLTDGEPISLLDCIESYYENQQLVCPDAPLIINYLARTSDIYFISSRSYRNATHHSRLWLENNRVNLSLIAGVICNIIPTKKADLCKMLFATYHFDDNPSIIKTMPNLGVLMKCTKTPGNLEALYHHRYVKSWAEIESMCIAAPTPKICFATQQGRLDL